MRILLATGAMYPEPGGVPVVAPHAGLAAADVAAALAAGWGTRRGEDVLTALPIPDGGPGTAQAIGAEPGQPTSMTVRVRPKRSAMDCAAGPIVSVSRHDDHADADEADADGQARPDGPADAVAQQEAEHHDDEREHDGGAEVDDRVQELHEGLSSLK